MVTSPVKVAEETSNAANDDAACEGDAGVKRAIDESENASEGEALAMEESPLKKTKAEGEEEASENEESGIFNHNAGNEPAIVETSE